MSSSLKHNTQGILAQLNLSTNGAFGLPPPVRPVDCRVSVVDSSMGGWVGVLGRLVGLKIGPKCSFPVVKCD